MPYPLPKLDMVAIPDFEAGAMENYGLVRTGEHRPNIRFGRTKPLSVHECLYPYPHFGPHVRIWLGLLGMLGGSGMALTLLIMKVLHPNLDIMHNHGPMFVIGSVMIVAGIQLLAIGLLGELQVRHYYTNQQPSSYAVDRLVRLASAEEQGLLSGRPDDTF